jgi:carbon-monoxide dehydrogenase small subunit
VNACLTLAVQADGSKVTTLAGLGTAEQPHPLQTAMIESGGVQCGYCTPGVIVAVSALLERNNEPTADEIREALSGNLCRCTGYDQIIEAVQAAKTLAEGRRAVDG